MKNSGIRLLVIHWFPLEKYPPVQNLLADCSRQLVLRTEAVSTFDGTAGRFSAEGVRIFRSRFPAVQQMRFLRLLRFLLFPLLCALRALIQRPDVLLYYEPHSAPAAFLALLLRPRMRLLIHYHEYRELAHFRDRGNAIARLGHWLECRWLHRRCEWVSQTNFDRVRFFRQDHPQVPEEVIRVVPNYPPPEWLHAWSYSPRPASSTLRLVYVGALSLEDTFIREVVEWVAMAPAGRVTLDIYAGNTSPSARDFLLGGTSESVRFFASGIPYGEVPRVLGSYDVGLILYRGKTRNYVFNAPNKLFEYLICGLDVWYPRQMVGIRPVAAELQHQRVIELDFERPEMLNGMLDQPRHPPIREWNQTAADALQPLRNAILGKSPCG